MMVIANLINCPYPDKWCGVTLNVIKNYDKFQ